jgi:hypothetical protein
VVQLRDAARAEGVPAVDQYAWNAFADVILEPAELANVESTRLIIKVHDVHVHLGLLLSKTS